LPANSKGKKARVSKKVKLPRLWLSEWTVLSEPQRVGRFPRDASPAGPYITAAYRMVRKLKYVVGLGWYRLEDEPSNGHVGVARGLMTANGARKQSIDAYAAPRECC
jgi:hypothetical protein